MFVIFRKYFLPEIYCNFLDLVIIKCTHLSIQAILLQLGFAHPSHMQFSDVQLPPSQTCILYLASNQVGLEERGHIIMPSIPTIENS